MTNDPLARKHLSFRELTRFISAVLVWAVFAAVVVSVVLGGASAGVRPFSMLVELNGHSEDEAGTHGAPGARIGPAQAEPEKGGGVGYIKDAALDQRRDWEEDSVAKLRTNRSAAREMAGRTAKPSRPAPPDNAA